jgi:nucleotide-binding universal stress UspA family protein
MEHGTGILHVSFESHAISRRGREMRTPVLNQPFIAVTGGHVEKVDRYNGNDLPIRTVDIAHSKDRVDDCDIRLDEADPVVAVAAPYAISLAQENQAHFALLYVIENQKTGELVHPAELADSKLSDLRQLVPQEAELWCEPRCMVEQGIPAEKILEAADRQHADLIVLGAQPAKWLARHLNAGTVHKVVSQAKCPVLTVHG